MQKFFLITIILFLSIAPFLAILPIKNYYKRYEEIAKKYDCYPIETCISDFDNDDKNDTFLISTEPTSNKRYNYRLKILAGSGNDKDVLNINYDSIDNSFRTHVAVFEENGQKKLVIYDTINTEQFFSWDGKRLSPTQTRTYLELEIRKAMALEDDTGEFRTIVFLDLLLIPVLGLYYLIFLTSIGIYFYFKKKSNPQLS